MNADHVTVAFVALDAADAIAGKAFLGLPADCARLSAQEALACHPEHSEG
jgi:hypothetical protein